MAKSIAEFRTDLIVAIIRESGELLGVWEHDMDSSQRSLIRRSVEEVLQDAKAQWQQEVRQEHQSKQELILKSWEEE